MVKLKVYWKFYIISALISLIVFSAGVYFGIFISKEKVEFLKSNLEEVKRLQEDTNLQFSLISILGNKSCSLISYELGKAISTATDLGDKVSKYSTDEKVKDQNFELLKKDYTVTLIKYWVNLERMRNECNKTDFITILFFYSDKNCSECVRQGLVLDYMKKQHPQNFMIFALDSDLDLNVIGMIKNIYEIKIVPSLVIDNKKFDGFVKTEDLQAMLCKKLKIC
jgi:hypothetical protein